MSKAPVSTDPRLTRRQALQLALAAGVGITTAARGEALAVTEVAPGVWVHHGVHQPPTPDNLGGIANIGFIVGTDAVAVIDTGGCAIGGERLRAAIQAITDRPIRHVIATHVHPDHLFGHAAFLADQPEFLGHHQLPNALATRGQFYLDNLAEQFGPAANGTEIVPPVLLIEDQLTLDLGGRDLILTAQPTAHTDNDLSIFDPATGTLWLSDLLFMERCPVVDGSLLGWLAVLETLGKHEAARVIPGHGPVSAPWPDTMAPQVAYLGHLRDEIRTIIAAGGMIEEAVETVGWDQQADWLLFEESHARNVTAAFTELEWE